MLVRHHANFNVDKLWQTKISRHKQVSLYQLRCVGWLHAQGFGWKLQMDFDEEYKQDLALAQMSTGTFGSTIGNLFRLCSLPHFRCNIGRTCSYCYCHKKYFSHTKCFDCGCNYFSLNLHLESSRALCHWSCSYLSIFIKLILWTEQTF